MGDTARTGGGSSEAHGRAPAPAGVVGAGDGTADVEVEVVEVDVDKDLGDLVAEHVDSLRLVGADAAERAERLERYGVRGKVEDDIAGELAMVAPLRRPARFELDHGRMVRALEVLHRNGARSPTLPRVGPLKPLATVLVGVFTQWIVGGYLGQTVNRLRRLYGTRAAAAVPGTPERVVLRRAHRELVVIAGDLDRGGGGLPKVLVGGVVIGTVGSTALAAVQAAFENWVVAASLTALLVVLFLTFSWCVLMAAAVARRRIRLSTEAPANELYETIGGCGQPPSDNSVQLALVATALMAVALVLVPIGISIAVAGGVRG